MIKKTGLFLVFVFILFAFVYGANRPKTLTKTYYAFGSLFRNAKFGRAAECLSKKDEEMLQNLAQMNDSDEVVDLEKELKRVWDIYYNEELKQKHVKQLKETEKRDVRQMEKILMEMKDEAASEEEMELLKREIKKLKYSIKAQILLARAKAKVFGKIIDKKVSRDYAMIAAQAEYLFPKKLAKDVTNVFIDNKDMSINIGKKRSFRKGVLKICVLYAFSKENNKWKLMLFSRDMFPNDKFSAFISKYEKDIYSSDPVLELDEEIDD